jgi:hypothetical protein
MVSRPKYWLLVPYYYLSTKYGGERVRQCTLKRHRFFKYRGVYLRLDVQRFNRPSDTPSRIIGTATTLLL